MSVTPVHQGAYIQRVGVVGGEAVVDLTKKPALARIAERTTAPGHLSSRISQTCILYFVLLLTVEFPVLWSL